MRPAPDPDPEDSERAPAGNWRRMHRGWGEQPKVRHRTYLGAWWHLRSNQRYFKVDADLLWTYPCWFTDENTLGRRHYHIGHVPKGRKLPGHGRPQAGKLYVGVFSVEGGFEVRTFETKPPTCLPLQRSIAEALREYLTTSQDSNRPLARSPRSR